MDLSLRSFRAQDLDLLKVWSEGSDLQRFMSRCRPRDPAGNAHDPLHGLHWFVIVVDGLDAGTLWLEPGASAGQAVLGILLAREDLRGRGLGARAIGLGLAALRAFHPAGVQVVLNVREANVRAIACYKACGFRVVATAWKTLASGESIPVLRMQLDLGPSSLPGSG